MTENDNIDSENFKQVSLSMFNTDSRYSSHRIS